MSVEICAERLCDDVVGPIGEEIVHFLRLVRHNGRVLIMEGERTSTARFLSDQSVTYRLACMPTSMHVSDWDVVL